MALCLSLNLACLRVLTNDIALFVLFHLWLAKTKSKQNQEKNDRKKNTLLWAYNPSHLCRFSHNSSPWAHSQLATLILTWQNVVSHQSSNPAQGPFWESNRLISRVFSSRILYVWWHNCDKVQGGKLFNTREKSTRVSFSNFSVHLAVWLGLWRLLFLQLELEVMLITSRGE